MNVARIKEIISYYDRRINRLNNRLAEEDNIVMQIRLRWAIRNCQRTRSKYFLLADEPFTNPLHYNLLMNIQKSDNMTMQQDEDDWITVSGTHILLGEEGTVKGGPPNLRGKQFSHAKSQKRPSKKKVHTKPEPPTPEVAKAESRYKERYLRDERHMDLKKQTLQEIKDGSDDKLKAKLAKKFGAKKAEVAEAIENGTLNELIDKYTEKGLEKALRNTKDAMELQRDEIATKFGRSKRDEEDTEEAIQVLGKNCISMREYDELRQEDLELLTPDDYALQRAYATERYGMRAETLNKKMYTGEGVLTDTEKDFVEMVDRTSVPLKRDVALYRGVGSSYLQSITGVSMDDPDFFKKLDEKVGTTVKHEAVTSTGIGVPGYFDTSTKIVCHIKAPSGTRVCAIQNFQEGEILIPAGTKMRLTGYSQEGVYGVWAPGNLSSDRSRKLTVSDRKKFILEMEVVEDE